MTANEVASMNANGSFAAMVIVGLAILAGVIALLEERRRDRAPDLFSDDFIPDLVDVAATDRVHNSSHGTHQGDLA